MQSLRRSFDADPACVPEVRRFIREALEAWNAGEAEWSACQLGSELATNAILHATTRFEIELTLGSGALGIRATDESARRVPLMRHYSDEATTGRGLPLIAALSADWGVDTSVGSKTVWCTVLLDSLRPSAPMFDDLAAEPAKAYPRALA